MTQTTKQHPNVYISQLLREFQDLQRTSRNSPFFVYHAEGYAEPAYLPLPGEDSNGLSDEFVEVQGFVGPQNEETTKELQAFADHLGAELVWYIPRQEPKARMIN